jgi:hypothetical protein
MDMIVQALDAYDQQHPQAAIAQSQPPNSNQGATHQSRPVPPSVQAHKPEPTIAASSPLGSHSKSIPDQMADAVILRDVF